MLLPTFHDIAGSEAGCIVAGVDINSRVTVFDPVHEHIIATFSVNWDNGGQRICIIEPRKMIVSGHFANGTVAAHCLQSGKDIWRISGLKNVQSVQYSSRFDSILVAYGEQKVVELRSDTGKQLRKYHGATRVHTSRYDDIAMCYSPQLCRIIRLPDARMIYSLMPLSFALLSATFSQDSLFMSEAAGPLRAIRLVDGTITWSRHEAGVHYLSLSYQSGSGWLHGLRFNYAQPNSFIDRISTTTGEVIEQYALSGGGLAIYISNGMQAWLLSENRILDLTSSLA